MPPWLRSCLNSEAPPTVVFSKADILRVHELSSLFLGHGAKVLEKAFLHGTWNGVSHAHSCGVWLIPACNKSLTLHDSGLLESLLSAWGFTDMSQQNSAYYNVCGPEKTYVTSSFKDYVYVPKLPIFLDWFSCYKLGSVWTLNRNSECLFWAKTCLSLCNSHCSWDPVENRAVQIAELP